jgi:predicted RND superfamily exporter protein
MVGLIFLLVTLQTAMVGWLGPIWGPLAIAGAALLIALGIFTGLQITKSIASHRHTERRHSAEKTALVTTAALTAVPMLLKSPLMKSIGIPVGGALAALYLLSRPGGHRDD